MKSRISRIGKQRCIQELREWLVEHCTCRFPKATVESFDEPRTVLLRDIMMRNGLESAWPESSTWSVTMDAVVLIRCASSVSLALAKLKANRIRIADVGEMAVSCQVIRPTFAFLLSPDGLSRSLLTLLQYFGRWDILKYHEQFIRVGSWDSPNREPVLL